MINKNFALVAALAVLAFGVAACDNKSTTETTETSEVNGTEVEKTTEATTTTDGDETTTTTETTTTVDPEGLGNKETETHTTETKETN